MSIFISDSQIEAFIGWVLVILTLIAIFALGYIFGIGSTTCTNATVV